MSNKQNMKLYTEEQVKKAFIDGMKFIAVDPVKYEQDANEYMDTLTSIEIPSDEEIEDEILLNEYVDNDCDFRQGAEFVINKIQGGNNEQ